MDRLDAINLFKRVVESGSFSTTAREAGVSQPAVSKQIAALETYLGAQLLRRTSRSMTLTEAGQVFYESALRLVSEFEETSALLKHGQTAPSGSIRVTAAPVFGRLHIVPKLPAFFARYPEISIELSSSERALNLIDEGIDLAVRVGDLADSSLVARRIASATMVTVATPAYLKAHGTPQTPEDLAQHACVIFMLRQEPRRWEYKAKSRSIIHQPKGWFRTADGEQIRAAVSANMGLAQVPQWMFAAEIIAGTIQLVLRDYEPDPIVISAVHPAGRRVPTRLRIFIDYLVEVFDQKAGWI